MEEHEFIEHNIEIIQGTDFGMSCILTDDSNVAVPLTDYTFAAHLRRFPEDEEYTPFTIIVVPAIGKFSLSLTKAVTALLYFEQGGYDVIYTNTITGNSKCIMRGEAKIYKGYTR